MPDMVAEPGQSSGTVSEGMPNAGIPQAMQAPQGIPRTSPMQPHPGISSSVQDPMGTPQRCRRRNYEQMSAHDSRPSGESQQVPQMPQKDRNQFSIQNNGVVFSSE